MTTFRILLFIPCGLFLLSACATNSEWVRRDYTPNRKGIVRYKNVDHPSSLEALQADAGDKMSSFCGGQHNVKILSEQLGEQISGSTTKQNPIVNSSTTIVNRDDFTYVKFECL